jgi:hypothetical protein
VKQCLIAIPGVAQPGQLRHLAFDSESVQGWDEQQPERCRRSAEAERKCAKFSCLRDREIAEPRKNPRPLATRPAAAGGHARLGGIVELFDCLDESSVEIKRFKNGTRCRARLHQSVGYKETMRRLVRVFQFGQPRMRKMDVSESIVAFAPTLGGAFDIPQH